MEKGDTDRKSSAPSLSSSIPSERTEVRGEEVRTFRLGGIGSVSNSIGRLGCDNDTMPPESQKRTRTYHSVQREPQQSGRGQTGQGAGYLHFQPARRNTTFISHPPLRPTALHTVESQRKVRNSTSTMDYLSSHDNFCTPDFLKSSFSPSPSSMYMYEQDRQDLHTSLHDTTKPLLSQMCATQDLTPLPPTEPEFDLNPQFENSNNLERFFGGALSVTAGRFMETNASFQSSPLKQELMTSPQEMKPAPAVTEVNIDPYLFGEDSDNVFSEGRKVLQTGSMSAGHRMVEDAKKDISLPIHSDTGPKTFTPLRTVKTNQSPAAIVRMLQQQSQSSPSHTSATSLSDLLTKTRTQKMAMGSTIPTTSTTTIPTTIKTEPAEIDRSSKDSKPSLPKILTSPSQNTSHMRSSTTQPPSLSSGRGVMPVAGQSRRPTLGQQGKSGSVEEKWKEIEKFIHDPNSDQPHPSTSSYTDRKRKRHGSGGSPVMSDEESVKSQRIESITDDDSDSDDDSDISDTPFEESLTELAKKSKQFFWQYNIQAKGPKGTRLQLTINDNDPHHPSNFEDPVFDPTNTSLVGIRHGGKARKGDGNEITPNPRKLYMIGQKLCKLNREINNVQLASDLPANVRSKSRKEKNKLSSRACRLKKKAQHEANKIKLFGLNREQGELLDVVQVIWPKLKERAKHQMKENIPFSSNTLAVHIDTIITEHCKTRIAGNTADYVNKAIAKVEEGDPTGGLAIRVKVK